MRIVGYCDCKGKTQSGIDFSGKRLFVIGESDKVIGFETDKFFLSDDKLKNFDIASMIKDKTQIRVLYNKYGRVDSLEILK